MRAVVIIFLFSLGILFGVSVLVTSQQVLDLVVFFQQGNNPTLISLLQSFTNSISFVSIGIPILILILSELKTDTSKRRPILLILICLGISGLASSAIKNIVKKPRPFVVDARIEKLSGGGSYSFPSGHTTEAVTAAIIMIYTFRKWYAVLGYAGWALVIMYSRMALGVHDLVDIIGGITVASGSILLVLAVRQKLMLT